MRLSPRAAYQRDQRIIDDDTDEEEARTEQEWIWIT